MEFSVASGESDDLLQVEGTERSPMVRERQESIYLDANATVGPLGSVIDAVCATMRESWGNPSSDHAHGARARVILETARDAAARLLPGIDPEDIYLTSGGTEGSNTVLACAGEDSSVLISNVEHAATLAPAEKARRRGAKVETIPVGADGRIDTEDLARALYRARSPLLVSIQWANGETGVIQPINEIAECIRVTRPDAFLHIDAAQAVGRIPTEVVPGISAVTFSGHKLHGPQGTGVLAFAGGKAKSIEPLLSGGGQEGNLRSGTQNVAGAAGLAVALDSRCANLSAASDAMKSSRDVFESTLCKLIPFAEVNGGGLHRVPNTSSIGFPGIDGMMLVARLDASGVNCSQGSACSSGSPEPSHVLTAMGLCERRASSSVRFSFSILNNEDEACRAAEIVADAVRNLA